MCFVSHCRLDIAAGVICHYYLSHLKWEPLVILSPLAQHAHDNHTCNQAETSEEGDEGAGAKELTMAIDPVFRPHLDDANPDKDTSRQSVQSSDGDNGAAVVAVEIREDTNADSHTDRSDESKGSGE